MVARKVRLHGFPARVQFAALHHDDAEAFVADIARPLKTLIGPAYKQITDRLDMAIALSLDLPILTDDEHHIVKTCDDWALACEAWHLMPSKGKGWWSDGIYDPEERPAPRQPLGLNPNEAAKSWLALHRLLRIAVAEEAMNE